MNTTCHSNKVRYLESVYPGICENIRESIGLLGGAQLCKDLDWPSAELNVLNGTLKQALEQDIFRYTKENIMVLKIFMNEITATLILKDEKLSTISFLANTGGLLGLCIGLSVVTFFELVFHFLSALFKFLRSSMS